MVMSGDYYQVGILIEITLLQNGKLPTLVEETLFSSAVDASALNCNKLSKCLGCYLQFHMLNYLLREDARMKLTSRDLVQLLRPKFPEQGSNALMKEKEAY